MMAKKKPTAKFVAWDEHGECYLHDGNGNRLPIDTNALATPSPEFAKLIDWKPSRRVNLGRRPPTKKRKRRGTDGSVKPLTAKQLEASKLHGECSGNVAEVARRMGVDRKTAQQHIDAAFGKLGKLVTAKPKTERLMSDRRGQFVVADGDEKRG